MKTELEKKYEEYIAFLKTVFLLHNKPDSIIELFESEIAALKQQGEPVSAEEFEKLLFEVHKWQTETFGKATPLSKLRHLQEETNELINTIFSSAFIGVGNEMLEHEFADNFLLLFGAAMSAGFTLNDIQRVMREKLEICKTREWGEPDKDGVVKHINDSQQGEKVTKELTNEEIKTKALEIVRFERLSLQTFTQEMAVNFIMIFAKWYREQINK